MKCPRCGNQLDVTHTITVGARTTRRRVCSNKKCRAIINTEETVANIMGKYGEGAQAIAARLRKKPT